MEGAMMFLVIALVYFLPSLIAGGRGSERTGLIFLVNLLFGWSLIGWIIPFIWAFTSKTKKEKAMEFAVQEAMLKMASKD